MLASLTDFPDRAEHGPAKMGEVYKIYLDASRAREVLDWAPRVSLREGLASTVDYFREQHSAVVS